MKRSITFLLITGLLAAGNHATAQNAAHDQRPAKATHKQGPEVTTQPPAAPKLQAANGQSAAKTPVPGGESHAPDTRVKLAADKEAAMYAKPSLPAMPPPQVNPPAPPAPAKESTKQAPAIQQQQ